MLSMAVGNPRRLAQNAVRGFLFGILRWMILMDFLTYASGVIKTDSHRTLVFLVQFKERISNG